MRLATARSKGSERLIRLGDRYRDVTSRLVVAEDYERVAGRRTGRILVAEAEPRQQPPRRWFCGPAELSEEPERRGTP